MPPRWPKSLGVATRPLPKWYCQMRLTITRAVSGLSLLAIQLASALRLPVEVASMGGSGIGAAAQRAEKSGRHLFGRTSVARRQVGLGGRVAADVVNARREGPGLIVAEHLDQLLFQGLQLLLVFGLHGGRGAALAAACARRAAPPPRRPHRSGRADN